jgi:hypothetical protein
MLLRTYARLVAMVLAVAALAGALGWVALGKGAPLYLFTAIVFAYAGSRWRDAEFTRAVVGSFGTFYLASGLILAVVFGGLEFPFGSGAYAMALGLAIVGGMSTVCARVLPCEDDPPEGAPRKG